MPAINPLLRRIHATGGTSFALSLTTALALALTGCPGNTPQPGDAGADIPPSNDVVSADTPLPTLDDASRDGSTLPMEESPAAPRDEAGNVLPWPTAVPMGEVRVVPNRDSAILLLPAVASVRDYRVFAIPAGVSVSADAAGHESVRGTTIFCAGQRQHNAPVAPAEVLGQVEVYGLNGPTRLVIEALDSLCPFPGALAAEHYDVPADEAAPEFHPAVPTFPLVTEAEITARYGSMVFNGHGAGSNLGFPAEPVSPRVLARTTVRVTPTGNAQPLAATFQDDFSATDAIRRVGDAPTFDRSQRGVHLQNSRWNFYTYGAYSGQFMVNRGHLVTTAADWAQDIFASNLAIPRRAAQLGDADYLHVTFEVDSDATARRYWMFALCGAEQAGATMSADGQFLGNLVQTPFFYQDDGRNLSVEGWNCLQLFPRNGGYYVLPNEAAGKPQSDITIVVNRAGAPARDNVVQLGPWQYGVGQFNRGWFRQQDAAGHATDRPILDEYLFPSPRVRLDLYIRRDRVVMYANGEQRLCNDFPRQRLTMSEAAVVFGHVLYHSAAERGDLQRTDWLATGQRYYLENTPFVDVRHWDNMGFEEHVAAPPGFDASVCYVRE